MEKRTPNYRFVDRRLDYHNHCSSIIFKLQQNHKPQEHVFQNHRINKVVDY